MFPFFHLSFEDPRASYTLPSYPISAPLLCLSGLPGSRWVNEKWQRTQTHVRCLFSLSHRALSYPSAPVQHNPRQQELNALRALIKPVHKHTKNQCLTQRQRTGIKERKWETAVALSIALPWYGSANIRTAQLIEFKLKSRCGFVRLLRAAV